MSVPYDVSQSSFVPISIADQKPTSHTECQLVVKSECMFLHLGSTRVAILSCNLISEHVPNLRFGCRKYYLCVWMKELIKIDHSAVSVNWYIYRLAVRKSNIFELFTRNRERTLVIVVLSGDNLQESRITKNLYWHVLKMKEISISK